MFFLYNWRAGASQSQSLQRQQFFYIYIIIYNYIYIIYIYINTDNDMWQKQPMQGRPIWNAREKLLGIGTQWNQLGIETPACLKLDVTSGSEFPRILPGRERFVFSGFEPHNSCDWRLNHGLLPLAKQQKMTRICLRPYIMIETINVV